jgi:serine/threonine protein phosphatase PrpC
MRIEAAGTTHVGMKREHNEDALLLLPEERVFAVADGMGGHASGEVASGLAVREIAEFFRLSRQDPDATWPLRLDANLDFAANRLVNAIQLANRRIHEEAQGDARCRGMGTTLAAVHFADGAAVVGWAGDSRVYRFRDGRLSQLSDDHSLLNDYLKSRHLTAEEIENFPHKHVIVRALGMKEHVEIDVVRDEPRDGDLYLVCSDGLTGMVPDGELEEILADAGDLELLAQRLVDRANAAGGNDNVTVVLVRVTAA